MEEIRTEQKSGGIAIGKAVLLKQPDLAAERREITAADPQPQPAPEFRHMPRFQQPVQAPPAAPAAEEAEEDAAASGGEETPVIESKRKRNWSSIFQKTFDKINSSFTAAEDEEI